MKQQFLKELDKLGLAKDKKILLALSGGVDSMVLLDLFQKTSFQFSIAHCNFSLRDDESDLDQDFIELVSNLRKIPSFTKRFNTKDYAEKNKISIQMAARELRYDWFNILAQAHGFDFIVTAHHYDDSVETVLINFIRGTGLLGLHGIKSNYRNIIRPLLKFHKKDILDYAQKHNIDYREDRSNMDNKYVRNKIRNKLIPLMQEINPNVIDSIGNTISRINDVEVIYQKFLSDKKQQLVFKSGSEWKINIKSILEEISSKQLLYEIISDFGFYDIDAVFQSLSSDSGKEFFNSNFYMIKDRNDLIVSKHILRDSVVVHQKTTSIDKPFKINFTTSPCNQFALKLEDEKVLYINYSKLDFPLLIRPWKYGDIFQPLGMKGFKKVSDYFIDNKFSLIKKKKARLLISNNNIVCIIGERLDDRFKLVKDSKKVYIVSI